MYAYMCARANVHPAAVSDDDSDVGMPDAIPAKAKSQVPAKFEDDEDDEEDEDEYQVETITDHKVQRGGKNILYHVKWLGYDEPTDMTWEPAENL